MTISIENISVYIGIIMFACYAVNYIVIKPLRTSIWRG